MVASLEYKRDGNRLVKVRAAGKTYPTSFIGTVGREDSMVY
jgi:hypothetical protein